MLARLTWPQFLEWQAFYEVDPWGELRADARNAVAIRYLLGPHMQGDANEPPHIIWPYWSTPEDVDIEAAKVAVEDHQRRWDEWERQRLAEREEDKVSG